MSILDELFSVTGKVAVVTGGAKGVGSMISRALVRAGADVLVVGRGAEAGAAFVNGLEGPGKAAFLTHDLGTKEGRSEEHTSELQSLMRISYAVFCLKKQKNQANK